MLYNSPILEPLIKLAQPETQQAILCNGQETLTPRQLLTESMHLGQQLLKLGLQKDDIVIIAVAPGADFLKVMYATMMIRCQAAIIDPEMGRELYAAKLSQLKPQWAFVDTRLLLLQEHPLLRYAYFKLADKPVYFPRVKNLKIIGSGPRLPLLQKFTSLQKLLKAPPQTVNLLEDKSNHNYLITYTSGTLQEPKGVLHSLTSLSRSINLLSELVQGNPNDRLATYLPHFVLLGITAKIPVFIYNPKLNVRQKLDFFEKNKISILFGPPSDFLPLVQYCEKQGCQLPASLNHIMLGSAPVHKSFLKRLAAVCTDQVRLTITYGMTEHLLVSTVDGREKINYTGTGDLVGKPVAGVEVKIAEDGELLVSSEQLFSRYYHLPNRPEFHATGDLARLDADGNILLMGRKKEMIIRSNTNIYPALYEDTIKKIPGVEEAAMVGIYSPEKEDEEVYLAVETSQNLTAKYILDKISYGELQIERKALPDEVVFMQVPRKGRQHKIDRAQIAATIKARKK
ncbi:class I adenylate-forming enzyme family protein [Adhaeribacter rhizoryzae]|uniref:Acyl--CoA ligase n=1 Tax=Adhaeribacter rhizoryzae TaxID=2607907 RepID=A0A5M6DFF5_9BACT|nr:class I adenylate-forming enzyme family protein [Adhaeribacter rhizoryzae]KAA5545002.1 acyl--CoA ligase [Adhaeribacter rhizoryzae]